MWVNFYIILSWIMYYAKSDVKPRMQKARVLYNIFSICHFLTELHHISTIFLWAIHGNPSRRSVYWFWLYILFFGVIVLDQFMKEHFVLYNNYANPRLMKNIKLLFLDSLLFHRGDPENLAFSLKTGWPVVFTFFMHSIRTWNYGLSITWKSTTL